MPNAIDIMSPNYPMIDIHCHRAREGQLQILSLDTHEFGVGDEGAVVFLKASGRQNEGDGLLSRRYFSLGIHPWFLERQDIASAMQILDAASHDPNLMSVGECGLDKCIDTPLDLQIDVFGRQIELAERLGKPLIIHCVRAFNELLQIKKARKIHSDWIIHGFNANPELATQLIKHDCYLSFGESLLDPRSHAGQALAQIPVDRLFLETDTSDVPIGEIYAAAAKMREIDALSLRQQILNNFKRVFLQ